MKIVNKKKFVKSIITLILVIVAFIAMTWLFVDFCTYPESYLTTWKYQLHRKIEQGDQEAIQYYQDVYVKNNRSLWED